LMAGWKARSVEPTLLAACSDGTGCAGWWGRGGGGRSEEGLAGRLHRGAKGRGTTQPVCQVQKCQRCRRCTARCCSAGAHLRQALRAKDHQGHDAHQDGLRSAHAQERHRGHLRKKAAWLSGR
jgi:hypothetical protein